MSKVFRIAIRLITLVVAISAVVIVLSVAFFYMLDDANARAPKTGFNLTTEAIERTLLGAYLRYRSGDLVSPADPDDAYRAGIHGG